jgi:hypothetical protein
MSFGRRNLYPNRKVASADKKIKEKRAYPRYSAKLNGVIVHDDGRETSCWLIDVSATGAQVGVASILGVPHAFTLCLENGEWRRAVVVRRQAGRLGLRFLD